MVAIAYQKVKQLEEKYRRQMHLILKFENRSFIQMFKITEILIRPIGQKHLSKQSRKVGSTLW